MLNMQVFPSKVQPTNDSRTYSARVHPSSISNSRSTVPNNFRHIPAPIYSVNRASPGMTNYYNTSMGSTMLGNKEVDNSKYITIDRKTNGRKCSVCHVTFTSGSHERDHMVGKKHAKMLAKVLAPTKSNSHSPVKVNPAPIYTPTGVTPVQPKIYSSVIDTSAAVNEEDEKNKYITVDKETKGRKCEVCHVAFTSGSHERDHMKGKKHAKMVVKVYGEFGRCEICDMKYESARDGINHLFSQIHIKKQRELDIKSGRLPKVVSKPVKRQVPVVPPPTAAPKIVPDEASEDDEDMQCIYTRKAEGKAARKVAERLKAQNSTQRKRASTQSEDLPPAKKQKKESTQKTTRFCTSCGDPVAPENNFCGACGAKLK